MPTLNDWTNTSKTSFGKFANMAGSARMSGQTMKDLVFATQPASG
jgi:hypothetical protein